MKNRESFQYRTLLVCGFILLCQNARSEEVAEETTENSVAYTVLSDSTGVDSSQAVLNTNIKFRKKIRLDLESGVLGDEFKLVEVASATSATDNPIFKPKATCEPMKNS